MPEVPPPARHDMSSHPRDDLEAVLKVLKKYDKEIGAGAAIASTIGIFIAAFGLFATNTQIADSRKALEATTVFNIQKDARELLRDLHQTPGLYEYIAGDELPENAAPDLPTKAQSKMSELVQFYSVVFNQHRGGVITGKYWETFANEICGFIRLPIAAKFWKEEVVPGEYGNEFKQFGTQCLERERTSAP
jgi:hypothetical protein